MMPRVHKHPVRLASVSLLLFLSEPCFVLPLFLSLVNVGFLQYTLLNFIFLSFWTTFLDHLLCICTFSACIRASLVAQLVKNLSVMWETWVLSLGWGDPLEKGKATHSNILAWRIPRIVYSSWGRKESDVAERLSLSLTCIFRAGLL